MDPASFVKALLFAAFHTTQSHLTKQSAGIVCGILSATGIYFTTPTDCCMVHWSRLKIGLQGKRDINERPDSQYG